MAATDAAVLIPIRSFDDAKTRLAGVLSAADRRRLAMAMAERVVRAARGLDGHVVSDDDEVLRWAAKLGAGVLSPAVQGLNESITAAVSAVASAPEPPARVIIAHADLPLADDLLFFILSTRMMPPIAVAIPIFLMYRNLGLSDTHLGMILLYTAVNISLAVWLLKGFIDEIPREYEEAALIDGYTRFQAFYKVVLPQAATGIASTAICCLIFAWNEYAFAVLLTSATAQTAPPFIPTIIGVGGLDWPAVAAGATIFLLPVMIFTILLRKHLLRGITFGAVRK